jgi:sulfur-oxidizing protein SoxY
MRTLLGAVAIGLLAGTAIAADAARENPLQDGESWADLRYNVFGETEIADGTDLFEVEAPYRAHEAATVPIVIRQTDPARRIEGASVVIDENPAPLAAEFSFGEAMAPLEMELRVRVDQYSNVRVLAETPEGVFMNGRFVKASGGCSAPATKDPELALRSMGEMRLKTFEPEGQMSTPRRDAQIMIRHPNYSGLQRDQITHLFIDAHFIDRIAVYQGDELLWSMEGGISISENPVFRFSYTDDGTPALRVVAEDTEGNSWDEILPKSTPS